MDPSIGFSGKMGVMSVSSEPMTEDAGVVKGTLTLNCFDSKSGKVKTKKIAISGVSVGDEASGMLTIKGQMTKRFQAEIGE